MSLHGAFFLSRSEPDFLGRLLDRSFGLSESVRPRVPSLFEPMPRLAVAPGIAWQTEAQSSHAEARQAPPESRPRRLDPHGELARQASRAAEANAQAAARADVMENDYERVSPRQIQRTSRASARLVTPITTMEASDSHIDARVPMPPPSRAAADRGALQANHSVTSSPGRNELARIVRPGDEPQRAAPTRLENPIATVPPVAALMPLREASGAETATVTVLPRPTGGESRAAPLDQGPIVNITIGRVEVRAGQSAAPTARWRAASAGPGPLSLDEYLKQRGGGR